MFEAGPWPAQFELRSADCGLRPIAALYPVELLRQAMLFEGLWPVHGLWLVHGLRDVEGAVLERGRARVQLGHLQMRVS
eukprot:8977903-Alexandrium_andersonii.AAC.1